MRSERIDYLLRSMPLTSRIPFILQLPRAYPITRLRAGILNLL